MGGAPKLGFGDVLCQAARIAALAALFSVTLFVSSVLLFSVQPMVGKMILPALGGAAAVWNTCMLFFQATLLAGYAYAHATVRLLGARVQALVHLVLLAATVLVLPIAMGNNAVPSPDVDPVFWLLGRLFKYVALPFFVVSASAPLFQRWFSQTRDRWSGDPYFLYAASNFGSLLALVSYPVLIERVLPVGRQNHLWAGGFGVLAVMALLCAVAMWRNPASPPQRWGADQGRDRPPTAADRLWWMFLTFVPSCMMLAVTTHITTNLAPVPLLWVIPLALYLLTFVLAFARRQVMPLSVTAFVLPYLVLPASILTFREPVMLQAPLIALHLLMFFVAAMVCHGRLVQSRPPARYLTQFYLFVAIGGALGGVFNVMIAPLIFNTMAEYPLMMILACLARPTRSGAKATPFSRRLDFFLPAALAVMALVIVATVRYLDLSETPKLWGLVFGVPAVACFVFKDRPIRFALGFAVVVLTTAYCARMWSGNIIYSGRNFFGVKRVVFRPESRLRALVHGNTDHGSQSIDPELAHEPLAYYHRTGPIGDVFAAFADKADHDRVGIIGLGTGSMAAYAGPGQHFTFYEIDPEVVRIAEDRRCFTFLAQCRGQCDVVVADGRIALDRLTDERFDLIILDAFNSDAVPVHLLTIEAIKVYLSRLEEGGILAFHVSNWYLDLKALLGNLADELNLACLARDDLDINPLLEQAGKSPSQYVVMARRREDFGPLNADRRWQAVPATEAIPIWTDQYCNLLSIFRWQ